MAQFEIFGLKVITPFVIVQSTYKGEFFILVEDDGSEATQKMEEFKAKIRATRAHKERQKVQRYTPEEVGLFLRLVTEQT